MNDALEIIKNIVSNVIDIANDRHDQTVRLISLSNSQKTAFLRDLSNACLAILGGSLTILTIDRNIVHSMPLFLFGLALVSIAYLLTYISRRRLNNNLLDILAVLHTQRISLITAAKNLSAKPKDTDASKGLSNELTKTNIEFPSINKFYSFSDKYVGVLLLIGAVIAIAGLFFKFA